MQQVNVYKLENGLRVILKKIEKTDKVGVGLFVEQGVNNEKKKFNGISNLLRNVLLNCTTNFVHYKTKNIELNKIIKIFKNKNGNFYSSTEKEYTSFILSGNVKEIDNIISIISEFVFIKKIDKFFFESEKSKMSVLIKTYESSPLQIKDRVEQALWGDISIGNPIIGNVESLNNITYDDVVELYDKAYAPENTVLVIAGNINFKKVITFIENRFKRWKQRGKIFNPVITNAFPGFYINSEYDYENYIIGFGFRTIPFYDYRNNFMSLITRIIFNRYTKLLSETLLRNKNYFKNQHNFLNEWDFIKDNFFSIIAFSNSLSKTGSLGICFGTNKKNIRNLLEFIFMDIFQITNNGISLYEYKEAINIELEKLEKNVNDPFQQIYFSGRYLLKNYIYFIEDNITAIETGDYEYINYVVKNLFKYKNMGIALLGNIESDKLLEAINFI